MAKFHFAYNDNFLEILEKVIIMTLDLHSDTTQQGKV